MRKLDVAFIVLLVAILVVVLINYKAAGRPQLTTSLSVPPFVEPGNQIYFALCLQNPAGKGFTALEMNQVKPKPLLYLYRCRGAESTPIVKGQEPTGITAPGLFQYIYVFSPKDWRPGDIYAVEIEHGSIKRGGATLYWSQLWAWGAVVRLPR